MDFLSRRILFWEEILSMNHKKEILRIIGKYADKNLEFHIDMTKEEIEIKIIGWHSKYKKFSDIITFDWEKKNFSNVFSHIELLKTEQVLSG